MLLRRTREQEEEQQQQHQGGTLNTGRDAATTALQAQWEMVEESEPEMYEGEEQLGPVPLPAKASDFVPPPAPAAVVAKRHAASGGPAPPKQMHRGPLQPRTASVAVRNRPQQVRRQQQQQQPAVAEQHASSRGPAASSYGPPVHYPHLEQIISAPQAHPAYMSPGYHQYPDLDVLRAGHAVDQAPAAVGPRHRHRQHHRPPDRRQAATAPPLSSAAATITSSSSTETETDDTDSDIASEAAAYLRRTRDAYDAMERARRKGGVVGLRETLSEFDFACPHCVDMDLERAAGPVVSFSCCSRRAHYSCMGRIPNIHGLALQNVPPCIQCLRPAKLVSHQAVLKRCRAELQKEGGLNKGGGKNPLPPKKVGREADRQGRLMSLWGSYVALSEALGKRGLVAGIKDLVKSDEDRHAQAPQIDLERLVEQGIAARDLLKGGWTLETIAEELELHRIAADDEYDDDWKRLGFDRNAVLELGDADMLYLMSAYDLHPYQLRRHFRIRLPDLWRSAERRRMGGRGSSSRSRSPAALVNGASPKSKAPDLSQAVNARFESADRANRGKQARGAARDFRTTEEICRHHGMLSPRQLAILGFDLHHLLVMGFSKDLFRNFPYFTMDDWITHLGFRKPHWNLLRLSKGDFVRARGVFAGLVGWHLDTLMNRWGTSANEMCEMGVASREGMLAGTPRPPPITVYVPHRYPPQQQQQPPTAAGAPQPPPVQYATYLPRTVYPPSTTYHQQQQQHPYPRRPPPVAAHPPVRMVRARAPQRPRNRRSRRPYPRAWQPRARGPPPLLPQSSLQQAYGLGKAGV